MLGAPGARSGIVKPNSAVVLLFEERESGRTGIAEPENICAERRKELIQCMVIIDTTFA